ncbi:hypothetical protein Tco_0967110 [Tanacetum coccineum]
MSSRTLPASRHSQSLPKSIKSLCSSSGIQTEDFTEVPDDESTLTFLVDLGYKGPLYKHPSMFLDHIHQPWRTLAAIINKCLSGKSASNISLRKSRIDIILGNDCDESDPEPARRRSSCIAFRDTSSMSEKMSFDPSQKLKGIQTLTHEEKLVADTMQALKASKKSIRSQPHAGGSSKGTGTKLGVLDESTVTPTITPHVFKLHLTIYVDALSCDILVYDASLKVEDSSAHGISKHKVDTNEKEEKNDDDDDKSIDLEKKDDEETDDEFDEEMTNAEDADTRNGDEEITDTAKADVEKTEEVKDDIKKAELPPTSSSLSVSSSFSNQFS